MEKKINLLEDVPCTVIDKTKGTYTNEDCLKNVICSDVFQKDDVTLNIKNNVTERDGEKFVSLVITIEKTGESMDEYIKTQRRFEKNL